MAVQGSDRELGRAGPLTDAALSRSLRSTRLALPAIHDRDTNRLFQLVTDSDASEADLLSFADDRKPTFVFAVIQSTARRLGEGWSRDRMDFAELSVCLTRLHRLLHHAAPNVAAPASDVSFAIMAQPFDDHILGGAVLEARLRTAGYATEFFPSWSGEELGSFDAVFLCISNTERALELHEQILAIRRSMGRAAALVAGGPGVGRASGLEGCDLVTSSLIEAVDFCQARIRGARP